MTPEVANIDLNDYPEVFIKDLLPMEAYILQGQRLAATLNYVGIQWIDDIEVFVFYGPVIDEFIGLRRRPDNSGTLESGDGNKVTIRKYHEETKGAA